LPRHRAVDEICRIRPGWRAREEYMEILRTVLVLLRRPATLVPVVLLALALGAVAHVLVPVHYTSKEIVVLTTPSSGTGTARRAMFNPLLDFEGSLQTSASMIVQSMNTEDVAQLLNAGKGAKNSYKVTDAKGSTDLFGADGPFLQIDVDSKDSADMAYRTTEAVGSFIRDQLAEQQKALHSPKSKYIVVADVVPPTIPEIDVLPKVKAIAGGLLAGLLLGLGCAYTVYRLRERSRALVAEEQHDAPRDRGTNGYERLVLPATTVAVNVSGPETGR
jgi:hypothetical protein